VCSNGRASCRQRKRTSTAKYVVLIAKELRSAALTAAKTKVRELFSELFEEE